MKQEAINPSDFMPGLLTGQQEAVLAQKIRKEKIDRVKEINKTVAKLVDSKGLEQYSKPVIRGVPETPGFIGVKVSVDEKITPWVALRSNDISRELALRGTREFGEAWEHTLIQRNSLSSPITTIVTFLPTTVLDQFHNQIEDVEPIKMVVDFMDQCFNSPTEK